MAKLITTVALLSISSVVGHEFGIGPILNDTNADEEAAPVFQMGTPTFFGSGCPANSLRVITASDGQSVSVLFSEYIATTSSEKTRDRKSCNMAVPVDVQPGISMGIFRVDYRGYGYVPSASRRSYARFSAEYYFAGMQGPKSQKTYRAGFDDDLFITNEIPVGSIVWSPCGASTNFRINSAITAAKRSRWDDDVAIAIDSVDTTVDQSQVFKYYFTFRRC